MRPSPVLATLILAAALAGCQRHAGGAPSAQFALAPPATPIAPGLWIQRVSDHQRIAVTRYCLDAKAAANLAAFGRQLESRCRRRDIAQAADGSWRFSTRCDMGGWGAVTTDGVARGDFAHHYVVEATAQAAGAATPAANAPRRVLADISWQSACPKDMRPGDVVWPDGRRGRLSDLAAPS